MKNNNSCRLKSILSSLVIICCLQLQAQNDTQLMDSLFAAPGNYETMNGNVLIAREGKVIYKRSFGYANFATQKMNDENSAFNIGSVTKTFTAVSILQLRQKGKLKLEDKYVQYFPEFPYPAISIRNLLSHTSGLPDLEMFFDTLKINPAKKFTNADVIPILKSRHSPLKFEPGTDWNYCNTNYGLLALLIEKLSGISYARYLGKNIFIPAGMQHTYSKDEPGFVNDTQLVTSYMMPKYYQANYTDADSVSSPVIRYIVNNFSGFQGQGMIMSTLPDLLKYDQALYTGKLISMAALDEAFTPVVLANGKDYNASMNSRLGKSYYGLGWEILADTTMGKIVCHGGSYPGIVSFFIRNVTKKQTIILFDNTYWTGIFFMGNMAMKILNRQPSNNILPKKSIAKLYGQVLMSNNRDSAFNILINYRTDSIHYQLSEREFNTLGYQFLQDGFTDKAEETFRVNCLLYPESFNTYDSYADALVKNGKKQQAVIMYQKSIALNSRYEDARNKLKKLLNDM